MGPSEDFREPTENERSSHGGSGYVDSSSCNPSTENGIPPGSSFDDDDEEAEARLAAELQSELEQLRNQTKEALERSWAEVERLQREGTASTERIEELERELMELQTDAANGNEENWGCNSYDGGVADGAPVSCLEVGGEGDMTAAAAAVADLAVSSDGGGSRRSRRSRRSSIDNGSIGRLSAGHLSAGHLPSMGVPADDPGYDSGGILSGVRRRMGGGGSTDGETRPRRRRSLGALSSGALSAMNTGDDTGNSWGLHENLSQALALANLATVEDPNNMADLSDDDGLAAMHNRRLGRGRVGRRSSVGSNDGCASMSALDAMGDLDPDLTEFGMELTTRASESEGESAGNMAVRSDMMSQLASLEQDKRMMLEELETKLQGKEAAIETLERTTSLQDQTIKDLEAELERLKQLTEEEEQRASAEMDNMRDEIKDNEDKAIELEQKVAEAERTLMARREREGQLRDELNTMEENVRKVDAEAAETILDLEEKLAKSSASQARYEEQNREMKKSMDEALEALRKDLMEFLPDGSSDNLIQELMDQFAALREKEEQLGEVLVERMQERQETLGALERMAEVSKRAETGFEGIHDTINRFKKGLEEMEGEANENSGPQEKSDARKSDRLRRRHKAAIMALEKAAKVQVNIQKSLRLVEEELMDRLASLEWNNSDGSMGENGDVSAIGGEAAPNEGKPTRRGSGNDVMKHAERIQEESREALRSIKKELEDELASIDQEIGSGYNGRDGSRTDKVESTGDEDEHGDNNGEDDLDKLESELEAKDAKIMSLQATTAERESTVESLRAELEQLQESTKEESQASLKVMEKLQEEVRAIVERVGEKDRMIASLSALLEQRRASEAALTAELAALREEAKDIEPDLPEDMCHVGL